MIYESAAKIFLRAKDVPTTLSIWEILRVLGAVLILSALILKL